MTVNLHSKGKQETDTEYDSLVGDEESTFLLLFLWKALGLFEGIIHEKEDTVFNAPSSKF